MSFRGKIWGILTAILGIGFLYVTYYQIPGWLSFMPDSYLKTLFWIGYIAQIIIAIVIKPFLIIVRDEEGSPFAPIQGITMFILGILLSISLYYVFDTFFGTSGVFTGDMALQGDLTGIMWFGYILITLLSMVIGPIYLAFEEPFTEEIMEQLGAGVVQ